VNETRAHAAAVIRREALASAAANFVINAAIQAALLSGKGPHRVSVDSIASREPTVFGAAVPMAIGLAAIGATITFFAFRRKAAAAGWAPPALLARPFVPFGLGQALSASLVVFGTVVAAGVVWQRALGEVSVGTPTAAFLAGLVAAVTSWYAARRTAWALLRE
jgi:hypothetical protein